MSSELGKREGLVTNRKRKVPPKSAPIFDAVLVGSSGQIPATVTVMTVERYEKPEF
jgi:hypothetical protein